MSKDKDTSQDSDLRQRAEKELETVPYTVEALSETPSDKLAGLIHELQVHQIELNMQNEELRRIHGELEGMRDSYVHLYDYAPVGYFTLDSEGFIDQVNLTAANMLQWERGKIVGKPFTRFIVRGDQDIFYSHRRRLLETQTPQVCKLQLIRNGGNPFHALLESILVQAYKNDSKTFRIAVSDITAQQRAEEDREKLQAQLKQVQKLESLGRLAGGVAHDFNNMLLVILGRTEMALERVDPDHPLFDNLQVIMKAAESSANLVRQLLTFARRQAVSPKVLNLNETVEGMLKMLRRLIGEDKHLVCLPGNNLWSVKMDPSQIDQVLANLCINARDAIAGVGKVTIETGTAVFDETHGAKHADIEPGEYVMLSVRDDGCGMDKETLDNLFDPFFTTKDMGQGIGLGLATVYGIVKQNNGFIKVFSKPGEGATFIIYIPRYRDRVEKVAQISPRKPVSLGQETILLVEDEPAILELITLVLEKLGYNVLAASGPSEAIQIAESHTSDIHLLVTDVIMPETNGLELSQTLQIPYPKLKCLFMSGHTADAINGKGLLEEGVNFIQKPFSMKVMATLVREVLDRG